MSDGHGTSVPYAPPGFTVVRAQGPVAHVVLDLPANGSTRISLVSGHVRPAHVTEEIWYDQGSGLWRDVYRVDGRARTDAVGKACLGSAQTLCNTAGSSLSFLVPVPWPPSRSGFRVTGRGTFRGHQVIWLESRTGVLRTSDKTVAVVTQTGVDPQTHRILGARWYADGHRSGEMAVSQQPDLPGGHVYFVVPKRGPSPGTPSPGRTPWRSLTLGYGLPRARSGLGQTPVWVGPRFRGYALGSVTVGRDSATTNIRANLPPVKFVRFDYGYDLDEGSYAFSIEEFRAVSPYFLQQGPRPGSVELGGTGARVSRGGLVFQITSDSRRFPLTRENAIAVVRALRPLSPNVNTLPTLRQQ